MLQIFLCDCGLRLKIMAFEWNKWATFYVIIVSYLVFMAYGILFTWRRTNFFHFHKQYSNLAYVVFGQILGEDCSHNRGEENYDWQGRIVSTRKKSTPLPPLTLCMYEPPWNWTQISEVSQRTTNAWPKIWSHIRVHPDRKKKKVSQHENGPKVKGCYKTPKTFMITSLLSHLKYQRPPQGHAVATSQSPREFRDLASSE
jgi:hypothetical protein